MTSIFKITVCRITIAGEKAILVLMRGGRNLGIWVNNVFSSNFLVSIKLVKSVILWDKRLQVIFIRFYVSHKGDLNTIIKFSNRLEKAFRKGKKDNVVGAFQELYSTSLKFKAMYLCVNCSLVSIIVPYIVCMHMRTYLDLYIFRYWPTICVTF